MTSFQKYGFLKKAILPVRLHQPRFSMAMPKNNIIRGVLVGYRLPKHLRFIFVWGNIAMMRMHRPYFWPYQAFPYPLPLPRGGGGRDRKKKTLGSLGGENRDDANDLRASRPAPPCKDAAFPIQSAHSQAEELTKPAVPAHVLPWIGAYYLLINAITLGVWGWDKLAAMNHRWRTPERTLRRLIFAGGFAGGLAGMLLFRHKTRHPVFYWALAGALAAHGLLWYAMYLLTRA
jgi:uncharacterized membrane protein YsdA (DUF1294 family)